MLIFIYLFKNLPLYTGGTNEQGRTRGASETQNFHSLHKTHNETLKRHPFTKQVSRGASLLAPTFNIHKNVSTYMSIYSCYLKTYKNKELHIWFLPYNTERWAGWDCPQGLLPKTPRKKKDLKQGKGAAQKDANNPHTTPWESRAWTMQLGQTRGCWLTASLSAKL